jgi:transmembrane sensor
MNRGKQHMDEERLIRFIIGKTDDNETLMIKRWIGHSDENKKRFESLRKIWALTKNPTKVKAADVNVDLAWKGLKTRMDQYAEIEKKHQTKQRSITYFAVRIAAVLILGLMVFSIFRYQSQQLVQVQLASSDSTITNNPLPDGTLISLNQNTVLEYPDEFSENERRVKLSGEAFFEVKKDTAKPFIIEAQNAIITVLGTSFNVKALDEEIAVEVLVEEGVVRLSNPDLTESTELRVGEKGIYIKASNEVKKETDIDAESLYWLNKTLLFRNTNLSMVFETLERLYGNKIKVENPLILNCQLTAKFSNESIDHIIDHISTIFELESTKDGKNILIKGDGCK